MVTEVVARDLRAAAKGLCVLAVDGLSLEVAESAFGHASIRPLRSTFPSTSTTAWLTAVTGTDPGVHGAVGMVHRAPGADCVTHLVTGETYAFGSPRTPGNALPRPGPTLFDRAAESGRSALAIGAELERLTGPWVNALLHGARIVPSPAAAAPLTTDPVSVAERTVREVEAVLAHAFDTPPLVWAYVNLDDHIHRSGYDTRLREALLLLDTAAARWADAGWSVLAHADHGQVEVTPSQALAEAWARLDAPAHCRMPGGGAGRVRWLHPLPGREEAVAAALRDTLGDHALVLTPDELHARGLLSATPVVRARIGEVVALATSPHFPVPDPSAAWEHGSVSDDETLVPLAAWNPAPEPAALP
ncbi:alkaline phosphatase family protein [Streptomyces sp. NBC_00151]|uniref:alkaline phosphatase family protein n=1 Tax=Streptomyces sp. NBC_00151 TaxID=2975669 RepID=UPI002DDAE8E5|nr:alkaline phosphatase family protein [Streptomyces sp. NBC_00151]WRZ44181.1 alkaline phosphatase family protein [Streptomyces sp. NBC_00151]